MDLENYLIFSSYRAGIKSVVIVGAKVRSGNLGIRKLSDIYR